MIAIEDYAAKTLTVSGRSIRAHHRPRSPTVKTDG